MKIIADDKIPYLKGVFESVCDIEYLPGGQIGSEELKDADALITRTRTKCNAQTLEGSNVKIIASATIGFDHIDTQWCESNDIKWTNSPGCNADSVRQYMASVFAMLVIEKGWVLKGKKIAVVGVGNVGSRVAKLAQDIGMKVFRVDPPRARVESGEIFHELKAIASKMDLITFHTPLNREGKDKTFHLCDIDLLREMKNTAIVVNSSRGEVIDGEALKIALEEEMIDAAVIDVWENEPEIDKELMDDVWLSTPHIAGYSQDGKANGTKMSVRAVSQFFNLGLDNWEPRGLPQPKKPLLEIDCEYLSTEQVLAEAFVATYPIKEDDLRLRMRIKEFEKQRGAYPIRREFKAFDVILKNARPEHANELSKFGFNSVELK